MADPATDLSHLGRALAPLRTVAWPAARAGRRPAGVGRRYQPIVIGLKLPALPGKSRPHPGFALTRCVDYCGRGKYGRSTSADSKFCKAGRPVGDWRDTRPV